MDDRPKDLTPEAKLFMKKIFYSICLWPMMVQAECVMQEKTVSQSTAVIDERTPIRQDVVPFGTGKKCIVDFRVKIANKWHTAFGEYQWDGNIGSQHACAIAVSRAEDQVRDRVGRSQTSSERILVCKDSPQLQEFANSTVGSTGDIGQFRIHPNYPNKFWYQGTQCRWFLDTVFTGQDIRNMQGIVCQLDARKWVVVDKF